MKKLIISALTAMLCMGLTACGETAEESSTSAETTTAATTAESETIEEITTTTTEAIEETPDTDTETTTAEPAKETGIVTMADNPDGLYPMPECYRRTVEEYAQSIVVNIYFDEAFDTYIAIVEDGRKFIFAIAKISRYESGEITNINDYFISDSPDDGYDGVVGTSS